MADISTAAPSVAIVGAGFGGIGTAASLRRAASMTSSCSSAASASAAYGTRTPIPGRHATCRAISTPIRSRAPALGPALCHSPEIQRYVESVARRHGVFDRVRLGTDVTSATWEPDSARWQLETDSGAVEANVLVCACGQLTRPAIPRLEGSSGWPGRRSTRRTGATT